MLVLAALLIVQGAAAADVPNERADLGVPAEDRLQDDLAADTPTAIPGGKVITTAELAPLIGSTAILIDVWRNGPHLSLPGANALPGAGDGGSFTDPLQRRLALALKAATDGDLNRTLIFFCTDLRCAEGYNAALRAIHLGYRRVAWYRGGITAWHAAGHPLVPIGQGGNATR